MNEKMIRYIFQRDDSYEGYPPNVNAINKLIEVLNQHEASTDPRIKAIGENFLNIANLNDKFIFFEPEQAKNSFYMKQFQSMQLDKDADSLEVSHELGHAFLDLTTKAKVPSGYRDIVEGAQKKSVTEENKETFKKYIEHLAKDKEELTEEEKGPVSDIIGSVFQQQMFRIDSADNMCWLPSSHKREYYWDPNRGGLQVNKLYDEQFANFYALKVANAEAEIATLRELFGDEFVDTLDNSLDDVSRIFVEAKDKAPEELTTMNAIKRTIRGENVSDLINISSLDQEKEKEEESKEKGIR